MRRTSFSLVALLSLIAMTVVPARAADPKSYKIGTILAMTGAGAFYGKVMSQGAQLAMEELNARGGVDGVKFELVVEDHKSGQPKEAVSAINKLVNIDRVPFVLTSYSSPTLAILPIANEHKVMLLNGGGVSPKLVNASPFLFHNRVLANYQALGVVERAKERGFKKMAMLHWNDDAGNGVRDFIVPIWKKMGGAVVADEAHPVGATDFTTQIAKIKQTQPDLLAMWTWGKDLGIAVKQARDLGFTAPIMGIDYTPDAAKIAGAAIEGQEYVTDYFNPQGDEKWTRDFSAAYRKKYGEEPEIYAANYYEGVYILAELIRAAKKKGGDYWNGQRLKAALTEIRKFPSVYGGTVDFQEDGTSLKRVALFEVKDGKPAFKRFIDIKK
ncbi:MAG: ABC transporter substrate-binding protein [Candidatus Rokubacteria bacterium]|nr:ABC transporter substrate-binding protein [Candidatus Rokubacteria bacterium]